MPQARIVSLCAVTEMDPDRGTVEELTFELDGIVGDKHRGHLRHTHASEPPPEGTPRRNERMWLATSVEELRQISEDMGLNDTLTPADLTANMCFEGFDEISKLPKGSLLKFPSGLELVVEEFCAPCLDKGQKLRERYRRRNGSELGPGAFGKAAKTRRGVLGVVNFPGVARVGDDVDIHVYSHPRHLALTSER